MAAVNNMQKYKKVISLAKLMRKTEISLYKGPWLHVLTPKNRWHIRPRGGRASIFWLQLISCSRFVNMAELHRRCDESSSSCSSDELDSCASKEHVSDREMLMFSKLAEDPMISY